LRFRRDHVANTPARPTGTGHRCREPAHPPTDAFTALHFRSQPQRIYGFLQTRPRGSSPAMLAADVPPGQFRAAPLPHRCWIPPVGAPGQDFHLRSQRHARHTRSGLRPSLRHCDGGAQAGRTGGCGWGINVAVSGEVGWPPLGRNRWPLTRATPTGASGRRTSVS
jgi:hypothetical protein